MSDPTPQHRPASKSQEENHWVETEDLSSPTARSEFITQHAELVRKEIVSSISARVPQLINSDKKRAFDIADFAMMLADRLGDDESTALSLRAKANAYYALRQNKNAVEHHRKAVRLFRSLGQSEQVARTLSSSLQPLILQGQYSQAFVAAREARRIFTQSRNRWRLARLDLNLGNLLDRQDRFAESLECYERAYAYLADHEQDDPEGAAVALHNMAVAYVSLNDFRKAEAAYARARVFAAAHGMPLLAGQADYNIAWLHYLRGDYGRAISMLRDAGETCQSTGDRYHVALCHLDLSEIYLELNLVAEAAEDAEQAEISFSQLGMQYERAKSITNLAVATGRQGSTERCLDLFLQARQIFGVEKNKVLPLVIDFQRAVVLFKEKRDAEARKLCLAALRGFGKYKITHKAIECHLLLARLHLRKKQIGLAQRECKSALSALSRSELPALSCQAYAVRGQLHSVAGRDHHAYVAYQRAREYLEDLRNHIRGEELSISFLQDRVEIYESLVELCMKRGEGPEAIAEIFRYIQQAKSRTLFDALSSYHLPSSTAVDARSEHAVKLRELKEELNWYVRRTEEAQLQRASKEKIARLREESRNRERELLKWSREHASAEDRPEERATNVSTEQILESLRPGTVIAEYFEVRGRIVVLLLGRDQARLVPLGAVSKLCVIVDLLQLQLSKLKLSPAYVTSFASLLLHTTQSHLQELYKQLVAPIRTFIGGDHVVVAPHGILHNLPFHAFHDGEQYLVDKISVSYIPSASIYALCHKRASQTEDRSLVLGVPDAALPFLQQEVSEVAERLENAEVLIGGDATTERLRQRGPGSRYIHIATHGYFRRDNPMFSGIRLGDANLSLYDLTRMNLRSELVTLSGCSTGLNLVTGGDELLGLARGLIRAGAESSVLTLWDVQDQSTSELMKDFYSHLASGYGKAAALQKAIIKVKSERPHPYYWAPYVLIGKP